MNDPGTTETVTILGETEVRVRTFNNGAGVRIIVRCLPGYGWWTCPDARTLRRLVDSALASTDYRRDGVRDPEGYRTDGWAFRYFTTTREARP